MITGPRGNGIPKWKQIHVDKGAKKANGQVVTAADIRYESICSWVTLHCSFLVLVREAKWLADEKLKVRYTVITKTKASYPASTLPTSDPNYYPADPFVFNERLFPTINKFFDPRRPTIQWERGSQGYFCHPTW